MVFKEWAYLSHLRSICRCWKICKTIQLSVINVPLAQIAVPKRPTRCHIIAISSPISSPYPGYGRPYPGYGDAHIQDMHILPYLIRYPGYGEDMGHLHIQDMQHFSDE